MSYRIKCHTLFDITNTGVANRKIPSTLSIDEIDDWKKRRNTQSNYDTLLQVLGLRSQPEDISRVIKSTVDFTDTDKFGFLFESETPQSYWSFEFSIFHTSVFDDGINELGALYSDCDNVPMIKVGTEWDKLPEFLDISPELRNIYFEVLSNE